MAIHDNRQAAMEEIDNALEHIYNMGDRDECSVMHVGHCLAAIASGLTHRQVVAFATPWSRELMNDDEWDSDERKVRLSMFWQIVQTECDRVGRKEFEDIIEELDEPFFSNSMVYYLPVPDKAVNVSPNRPNSDASNPLDVAMSPPPMTNGLPNPADNLCITSVDFST